jgi:FtsH-binding integral membrane protein
MSPNKTAALTTGILFLVLALISLTSMHDWYGKLGGAIVSFVFGLLVVGYWLRRDRKDSGAPGKTSE